jgi:hypothetical protein
MLLEREDQKAGTTSESKSEIKAGYSTHRRYIKRLVTEI